jgi:hypothetical protein
MPLKEEETRLDAELSSGRQDAKGVVLVTDPRGIGYEHGPRSSANE